MSVKSLIFRTTWQPILGTHSWRYNFLLPHSNSRKLCVTSELAFPIYIRIYYSPQTRQSTIRRSKIQVPLLMSENCTYSQFSQDLLSHCTIQPPKATAQFIFADEVKDGLRAGARALHKQSRVECAGQTHLSTESMVNYIFGEFESRTNVRCTITI